MMHRIVNGVQVELSPEEEAALLAEWAANEAAPAPAPQRVSMRQARRALRQVGLYEMVGDLIDGLDEPARADALIDWEFAQEVRRDFGLVLMLAPALGLDDDELDDLFRLAETFK